MLKKSSGSAAAATVMELLLDSDADSTIRGLEIESCMESLLKCTRIQDRWNPVDPVFRATQLVLSKLTDPDIEILSQQDSWVLEILRMSASIPKAALDDRMKEQLQTSQSISDSPYSLPVVNPRRTLSNVVQELLEAEAAVRIDFMHMFCQSASGEILESLLRLGIDAGESLDNDGSGYGYLYMAVVMGNIETASVLIRYAPDADEVYDHCIKLGHLASYRVMDALLQAGHRTGGRYKLDLEEVGGHTPLMRALNAGSLVAVEELLRNGHVNVTKKWGCGMSAWDLVKINRDEKHPRKPRDWDMSSLPRPDQYVAQSVPEEDDEKAYEMVRRKKVDRRRKVDRRKKVKSGIREYFKFLAISLYISATSGEHC